MGAIYRHGGRNRHAVLRVAPAIRGAKGETMETQKPRIESYSDAKGVTVKLYGAKLLFPYLVTPDEKERYRATFLVPKNAQGVEELKTEIVKIGKARFAGQAWKSPCLKDGDGLIREAEGRGELPDYLKEYAGMMVLSGTSYADKTSKRGPDVRGDCYSGSYVAAGLRCVPYTFDDNGTKSVGIKAYLNAVVFMADGERVGGSRMTAEDLDVPMPDQLHGTTTTSGSAKTDDIPF